MGKVVDGTNASRDSGYLHVLEKISSEGECPFCEASSNYLAGHKHPIFFQNSAWTVTLASWPYDNSQFHFLFILRDHKEHVANLNTIEWTELGAAIQHICHEHEIGGGAVAFRFGPPEYTGATVFHFHAHLIVPEIDETTGRARLVDFPIG